MGSVLIALVIQALVFGSFCGFIAGEKNRSYGSWFALGFFFSILAVFALIAVPKIERPSSPDDNRFRGERLPPMLERAAAPPPQNLFDGPRDVSLAAYQLFLTKRFGIEKNNTLDKFVIGNDVFDTLPAVLGEADARYARQLAELAAQALRLECEASAREQSRLTTVQRELAQANERRVLEEARRIESAALARKQEEDRKKAWRKALPWALGAPLVIIAGVGFLIRQHLVQLDEKRHQLSVQQEEERHAWQANVIKDCADCPEMLAIPAGKFEMGSGSGASDSVDEQPLHQVELQGFLLGRTEVTQGQWRAVMGNNPSVFKDCGDDCPVENVSRNDALQFASKLSQKTGKAYRLPSEAEWEYAARAGGRGDWRFGDDESQLGQYAWFTANSGNKTHPVGQKKASVFGLRDMHGNVCEWVLDDYHDNYQGAPSDGSVWVNGSFEVPPVFRGGAWSHDPRRQDSAFRNYLSAPLIRQGFIGLRIARTL